MVFNYKEWYGLHKDRISQRRKRKYSYNGRYRESIKRKSRQYYNERRKVNLAGRLSRTDKDGNIYYTIGKLSESLKKAPCTIRNYHKRGIIPEPNIYDNRGWRLYTQKQVDVLVKVFREFKHKKLQTLQDVKKEILKSWGKE